MMFMGDAGVQVEEMLLQNYGKAHFRASLYKVGHHGSTTSNSTAWLEAVQPEYAVISSSADNAYGHPHGAVVLSLEEMGVQVLRTATMGEIVFECDGTELYLLNEIKEKA
jgi:beta-lactamase superfamily II metal-dependent hydrolase